MFSSVVTFYFLATLRYDGYFQIIKKLIIKKIMLCILHYVNIHMHAPRHNMYLKKLTCKRRCLFLETPGSERWKIMVLFKNAYSAIHWKFWGWTETLGFISYGWRFSSEVFRTVWEFWETRREATSGVWGIYLWWWVHGQLVHCDPHGL